MSSAKSRPEKEPANLQSTRQMLDELDALMDRMLALPVNELDDAATPPREITPPRESIRMPTVSATLTVLDPPVNMEEEDDEAPPEEEIPRLQESFPSYSTDPDERTSDATATPLLLEPSYLELQPDPDPIPEEVIPPSIAALPVPIVRPEVLVKPLRRHRRSLGSYCLLPLLWFNQLFDLGTILLGPPGRWLRGSGGRHLLGWVGLAFLAATGLWLVKDWLGWTW